MLLPLPTPRRRPWRFAGVERGCRRGGHPSWLARNFLRWKSQVFAPTNAAFDKLPAGTVDTLLLPENKEDLIAVLTYHVVPGKIMSTDLSDGQEAATVQGEEVTITIADGTVKVNDATVETADVEASNGVIHVIDSVLLPPASNEEPTKNIVETAQSVDDLSTPVWKSKFYGAFVLK